MTPLRVGLLSGQLKPNHQFIAWVGFGEGLFGTEANVERGKEHPEATRSLSQALFLPQLQINKSELQNSHWQRERIPFNDLSDLV